MDKLLTSDTFQKFCTFLHEVDDILSSINTENKVVEPKETQSKSYKSHNFQHFMSHGDKEQQTTDLTSVLLTLKHVVTSLEMLINEKTTETKLQKQSTQTTTSKKEHNQQSGSKHSDTKKKGGFGLFKKSDKVPKQLSQRSILKGVEKHLKEWSGKQISGIVFDSDLDGDGRNSLATKLMNKSNLYFIHFDGFGNIFGGYVFAQILCPNKTVNDDHGFMFSLYRNNMYYPRKYEMKPNLTAFFCMNNNQNCLYGLGFKNGWDILIYRIGDNSCTCKHTSFECNGKHALTDLDSNEVFGIKRLVVVEMKK